MVTPEIHDITPPGDFLPDPTTPWWIWAIVVISLLTAITLITLWLCKTKTNKLKISLLDDARTRLAEIREQAPTLPSHTIATQTSLVIRHYLETAFKDPAIFETNEELTLRPKALQKLHPDSREPTKHYLTRLSALKYSPTHETATCTLIDEAENLLAHIEINIPPTAK